MLWEILLWLSLENITCILPNSTIAFVAASDQIAPIFINVFGRVTFGRLEINEMYKITKQRVNLHKMLFSWCPFLRPKPS